jgi:hypothetical protein
MTRKGVRWHRDITWVVSETGCWNCTSHHQGTDIPDYPRVKINGKSVNLNRYHYELYKGAIPPGLIVRHTCDNKRCINPDHLLLGTNADNARDAMERGLYPRGERHGCAKLNWKQVHDIRASTDSVATLAIRHNVTVRSIYYIRQNETWVVPTGG